MLKEIPHSKKKNEIVFKIPEFPHISETFIIAQILTAIRLGYSIKIITRKLVNDNIRLIDNYDLQKNIIIENYNIPKNKIIRSLKWLGLLIQNFKNIIFIFKYYNEHTKFSLTWLYEWAFFNQFNQVAIVHVQYGTNYKPLGLLKKINYFKPALIVTFHGHDAFFPLYGYIENNGYYNNLFNNDVLVTANTPYLANKIVALGCPDHKIKTIPVGVNTAYFHPIPHKKTKNDPLKLISIGRLDKVKGHKYCIEVISQLLKNGVNVSLTIIGEGEERTHLETLIKHHNLHKFVNLLGSKTPREVRDELWSHDVYLLLAVPVDGERRETQGLATLEAQACGLPAIVFDSGGIKYTVKNNHSGFVCKEYDTDKVVEKITYLFENRQHIKTMGEKAVAFVNNEFSQTVIDAKWQHIYKKLTKNE